MTKTVLYRHRNAASNLLYVGITSNPAGRLSHHKARSPWADDISRIEMEWFDCRDDAAAAERIAVRDEGPLYNRDYSIRTNNPIDWLVSHWGTRGDFAAAIGGNKEAVHKWAKTGRIPSDWQAAAVDAAQAAGMDEIDAAWMLAAHDRRRTEIPA